MEVNHDGPHPDRTRHAPAYAPGRTVPGAIKLASNELSFPTLPAIAAAIADAVVHQSAGHQPVPGQRRTGPGRRRSPRTPAPRKHTSIAGYGSVALCQQLVQATAGEGDEVLFGWRSFEAYPIVTQITGATSVRVPVTAEHELDLPAMAAAITPATRLIFVCTPNNPTGTAVRRADLVAFLDAVPDDVLVVIDEAYREFDTAPDSPDGLEFALTRPNVLTLRTLSKAYGLAGLRVGYAVGDPHVITALRKVAIPFALSSLGAGRRAGRAGRQGRTGAALAAGRRRTGPGHRRRCATSASRSRRRRRTSSGCRCASGRRSSPRTARTHKVIVRAFPDAAGGVRVTIGSPDENDAFLRGRCHLRGSIPAEPARPGRLYAAHWSPCGCCTSTWTSSSLPSSCCGTPNWPGCRSWSAVPAIRRSGRWSRPRRMRRGSSACIPGCRCAPR